ncbi:MAG: alanine racemase [Azoarcus sp.]|nr:alanine racemase [Azoarcus sp.]
MRPARALIDLDALRHNYRLAHEQHGGRAFAVLKANAYGHGATLCAQALAHHADGFAVAFVGEALKLRAAGIANPILVLEGAFDTSELLAMVKHNLWPVVHHPAQIAMIEKTNLSAPLRIWIKVNSGMNRAGFPPAAVRTAWQRLIASGKVKHCAFMSHFARADEPHDPATTEQILRFEEATKNLPGERSLANSAAILAWPHARRDWARPGIMLYGADPLPGGHHGLSPVMTLESKIVAVRELGINEPLGYGARFVTSRPTRVGLVAMGYADGYPRSAPDGTLVAVDRQLTALIGRVSMDMLTVDITDLPNANIGSTVELWGLHVPVNQVAAAAGTISYELLCNVKRVNRAHLGKG